MGEYIEPGEEGEMESGMGVQRTPIPAFLVYGILVTKTDAKLSDAAQKFFDFALDPKNGELISKAGVVPAN